MGQEIERRFLVTSDAWTSLVRDSFGLRQGYLSSNAKATVRVRIRDESSAVITLKGATKGISRAEYEYSIPIEDARELMDIARPNIVEKHRHEVPLHGLIWEIDVFAGRHAGLVMAEVELESADQPLELPDWIGTEVTDDDRYANASLSRADAIPVTASA